MELIRHRHKASKFAPDDFISNMPDIVITNILDRLPLQDAVRTSVLSRNWRFKWTMLISKLVFDGNFFDYLRKRKGGKDYDLRIISRILLQLTTGAITKFVLSIGFLEDVEDEDLSHWILFLSRKGIKDFTLEYFHDTPLKLSTHLFSCLELKHLELYNCYFNPPSSFRGFPNLLSLELRADFGENPQLGEFFTRCPLLEILTLEDLFEVGTLKAVEIAKVGNLKTLSLNFCDLGDTNYLSSGTIFELLGYLPKLEELCLDFQGCESIEGVASNRFSIAFPCLKALKLSKICLDNGMKLSCAFELIGSCPNLQTLEITACDWDAASPYLVDYNTAGMLQLRSVMFEYLKGSENEVCLIKYLLASSPFLKKIVIRPKYLKDITSDEKLAFSMKLLKLHRASTVVEIDLF